MNGNSETVGIVATAVQQAELVAGYENWYAAAAGVVRGLLEQAHALDADGQRHLRDLCRSSVEQADECVTNLRSWVLLAGEVAATAQDRPDLAAPLLDALARMLDALAAVARIGAAVMGDPAICEWAA